MQNNFGASKSQHTIHHRLLYNELSHRQFRQNRETVVMISMKI